MSRPRPRGEVHRRSVRRDRRERHCARYLQSGKVPSGGEGCQGDHDARWRLCAGRRPEDRPPGAVPDRQQSEVRHLRLGSHERRPRQGRARDARGQR
jgi:hypothetical protein